jgi:hypothetical protein
VHWDPCGTITFRIDPTLSTGHVSGEAIATLWDAIAVVEMTTGLDFVFRGTYDATFTLTDDGGTPGDPTDDVYAPSLPSDAAVGLAFADDAQVPAFGLSLLGFAIPQWLTTGEIVIGTVTLNASADPSYDPYLIWLHELAHLVGLAHVPNGTAGELMQPIYDPALTGYGPGDLEGLWWVGAAQPCFTALVAPDAKRTGALLTDVG